MFRVLVGAARIATTAVVSSSRALVQNVPTSNLILLNNARSISSVLCRYPASKGLLVDTRIKEIANNDIVTRNVTKFSYRKGRRKAVKAVLYRFFRLHWGGWIRTKCGRNKKLWKKSPPRKRRLRQHVFCNATQSYMLDKMVGSYWRKPKYYVDDPYEPYHTREEWLYTSVKPRPYFPEDH